MNQFEKFLTEENFQLAFIRLRNAPKNFYKSLYYEDLKNFSLFLDENIKFTVSNIKEDIYKPEKSHKFFIPKKDNLARPISVLNFIDLLVYQALANIIADTAYQKISPFYDYTIFGNIVNKSTAANNDKYFFYKPWKKKWNRFNEISRENFDNGYKYLCEFDIASFFDTIDHNILCEILQNEFNIEENILNLLSSCLEAWTADSNHKSFNSKHGIPQGPIASPFLADLYLFYVDTEIKKFKKKDFKYIRYVDDIRIFTKDSLTAQKLITLLDLISRDIGLIPQASKIKIREITDIEKELKLHNPQFSEINKEYKKPSLLRNGRLKSKTHNKLKNRLLKCFIINSEEQYLDKTLIRFSLYRLNKDKEIKQALLENYSLILPLFEDILFYLSSHFEEDTDILKFITQTINDEDILYHHLIALCFKYFPKILFDETIFEKFVHETHRHWLVKFYIVAWLYHNQKKEIILSDVINGNYFLQRENNYYKYISSTDSSFRNIFINKLLESTNTLIALQGLSLSLNDNNLFSRISSKSTYNPYIKFILKQQNLDIILHTLKDEWGISEPELFFNQTIWDYREIYEELKISFLIFQKTKSTDPSKALMNLNIFNNLIFDKLCNLFNITKSSKEFGINLNSNYIRNYLPMCNAYWTEINEKRNQKTDAHPYDKYGQLRIRINRNEFNELIIKEIHSIRELCDFKHFP